jgi:sugar diacid utilization regulator
MAAVGEPALPLGSTPLPELDRQALVVALKRRLVSDPGLPVGAARAAAQLAGISLSEHYWPAVVAWDRGILDPVARAEIENLVRRHDRGSFTVALDERTLVLALADSEAGRRHEREVHAVVRDVVRLARDGVRLARDGVPLSVRGIVADATLRLSELPAHVRCLARMHRYPKPALSDTRVLAAKHFALEELMHEAVDPRRALEFVRSYTGALLAYDRDHGTNLADTLELSLDFPRRDDAARASYMHRNTFRRHLAHALELVQADLNDPDERLAVHVALRLRRLLKLSASAQARPRRL